MHSATLAQGPCETIKENNTCTHVFENRQQLTKFELLNKETVWRLAVRVPYRFERAGCENYEKLAKRFWNIFISSDENRVNS